MPAPSPTRRAVQANLQRSASRNTSGRFGIGSSVLIVGEIEWDISTPRVGVSFFAGRPERGWTALPLRVDRGGRVVRDRRGGGALRDQCGRAGRGCRDLPSARTGRGQSEAALQAGIGLTLGIAWGWVLLDTTDFTGVSTEGSDTALTLALTAIVAACVCVLACAYPTLRGLRLEPTEALRQS